MDSPPNHDSRSAHPRSDMVRSVERLARVARVIRVVGASSSLVMLGVSGVACAAGLDALVRFPMPLRWAILVGLVAIVAVDLRRFVIPALRFRPQAVDIALRIERMRPELTGRLASAVEFERSGEARARALAGRALRDAEERASGMSFRQVLRLRPSLARLGGALACVLAVAAFFAVEPHYASIALRRVLMPWSDAVWPARTAVEGLVADGTVAARGRPFALRARLTEGEADRERVRAEFRMWRDGAAGEWMDVALARQPSGEFERFVDADGERLEVRFLTSDAATEPVTVRLVDPPAVASAAVTVTPPAYAAEVVPERRELLGDAGGVRGILRDAVLEGSSLRIELELTREVPLGEGRSRVTVSRSGAASEDSGEGVDAEVAVDADDPTKWTVMVSADGPARIAVLPIDADGIEADEEIVIAFDTVSDRPPTATMAEPLQDESVVADARIAMRADARDDLALTRAGIEIATRIGKDGSEGMVFDEAHAITGVMIDATTERMLDLSSLGLAAGDSVVLRAYAEDALDAHARVRSAPRTLRVVGEDEFERQIRGTFAGVRRDAMRLDERQGKARDALERDPTERAVAEMQGAVTEGANRMREAIDDAIDRLRRNGRDEGVLAELAEQARELAATAEARSAEASGAVERAREESDAERRAEQIEDAAGRQEAVRAELEDLVELLDRDQDAWVARRRLEALANRIRQGARETDQAAQRSNGESRQELSPDARAEIDALADRQQQAAEEAEQVSQALRERAEELRDADPQQSKALEDAARAIEDGKVREEMEQAARDAEQNRLSQSKQAQDRAADALQKATEALNQDRKVRAEELARELESLVDSIRRLIEQAEGVRDEVRAVDDADDEDRERAAMGAGRLSQNTRGVAADARATGREAARVARTLDAAAGSLGAVAGGLRSDPYDSDDTMQSMDAALKSLADALDQAEEAAERAEQRAEQEKREELLEKYRDFLEREASIRASVEKIVPEGDAALGRRELIESRRLGTVQEELRLAIVGLLEAEEEIRSSDALVEMHDAIDDALRDAKAALGEGKPGVARPKVAEAIIDLGAIVAALDDAAGPQDEDPFGESEGQGGEGGGEGSGQSGGAVPPAAEIKLLRAMQESLARRTRALAEEGASLDAIERATRLSELAARQERILELAQKIADKINPGQEAPAVTVPPGGDGQPGIPPESPSESSTENPPETSRESSPENSGIDAPSGADALDRSGESARSEETRR
ncbi:MAG: hypothetical protein ACO31E_00910 [Phycisphaerales bacterium]